MAAEKSTCSTSKEGHPAQARKRQHVSKAAVLTVIVNYNGGHYVEDAVASLLAQTLATDVLVVDNASSDGSVARLRARFPQIRVVETGENRGVVAANMALDFPEYEYYYLFNPDAFGDSDTLGALVAIMRNEPRLGILGATLVEYDEPAKVQSFTPYLDLLAFPVDRYEHANVAALPRADWVDSGYACSAAALVRARAFREADGLDESFFMFADETDLAWRLRLRGWLIGVAPGVRVRHVGGASALAGIAGGVYETSLFRIFLRERNTLRMCIKCYGRVTLAVYLVIHVPVLLAEALALTLLGRRAIAATYLRALREVWAERARLRSARALIQGSRTVGEREVWKRIYKGYGKLRMLLRVGMPRIKEFARAPQSPEG